MRCCEILITPGSVGKLRTIPSMTGGSLRFPSIFISNLPPAVPAASPPPAKARICPSGKIPSAAVTSIEPPFEPTITGSKDKFSPPGPIRGRFNCAAVPDTSSREFSPAAMKPRAASRVIRPPSNTSPSLLPSASTSGSAMPETSIRAFSPSHIP